MEQAGIVVDGQALHAEARYISGPDRVTTDRISTEVKEMVGGYYVIKANSMDEVSEIAQDYPDFGKGGTVEIRETVVFDQ